MYRPLDIDARGPNSKLCRLALTVTSRGVQGAGAQSSYDWLRYLVTRYEPQDGPQTYIVGFLRSLFGERVLPHFSHDACVQKNRLDIGSGPP